MKKNVAFCSKHKHKHKVVTKLQQRFALYDRAPRELNRGVRNFVATLLQLCVCVYCRRPRFFHTLPLVNYNQNLLKNLIKYISQVEQSNIESKEDITEQEKIDKEQRRRDEMELLEESIEILKIYKLL